METTSTFMAAWDQYMYIGGGVCVAIGVLILLYHEFKVFQVKDYKEKYDYVNLYEIRYFWYAVMAFILAGTFLANTIASHAIETNSMRWFYVRTFIVLGLTVIAYFLFFSLVKIYYPRFIERRLTRLRNTPRISPAGNIMRKLNDSEVQEHHLEGTRKGDDVHSVDYDVWIDEKTGFKKIEKYNAYEHAEECSECGYYTMKIDKEEIEEHPTPSSNGLLLKHFKCSYCGHREQHEVVIARLSENVT
ncbi:hypothetical protein [Ohtaekwangia sp.]|uniref:hypothetical protein n=1 Tax=Ohtaekwangia sp. TaxID=2066019 RepID=UPI002F91E993